MSKKIVLLHGLMTNSLIMKFIEKKLLAAGHEVYQFDYQSVKYSKKTLEKLHLFLNTHIQNEDVYFIAHSMGGLVLRNYFHHYSDYISHIKGVITIATPHKQSVCAHNIVKLKLGRFLGTSVLSGLTIDAPNWHQNIPIGCIAGLSSSKLTANFFVFFDSRQGDGTVFLDEAILETSCDSVIISGSHTGLLFKPEVANQCLHFLEYQQFKKA
jgi:pimeloyl-ACP methyl ester carboxylesterase